jgi:UDP-3-O-[3-hydroxymyristoyl] glucosamine N-acyltransferase
MSTIRRIGTKGRIVSLEVGESTRISSTALIGAGVKIGKNVKIGRNAEIGNYSVIGDDSVIGANARLGMRVKLRNGTTIGRNAVVGDYSLLVHCTISENCSIGERARCAGMILEGGTHVGTNFQVSSFSDWFAGYYEAKTTVIKAAIIGDNVSMFGQMNVGGYGSARRTVIGDETTIDNEYSSHPITIADYVDIGKRCLINRSNIDLSASIGDDVRLDGATIGWYACVGNGAHVQSTVGRGAHVGAEAIIRPNANILEDWFIPDGAIVNPIPGSVTPFVIPRVNPAIIGE